MEEYSYRLILEYFKKTISDDGLTQLQEWIEENPDNLAQFSETIQILEASKSYFNQPAGANQAWERIQAHISQPKPSKKNSNKQKLGWLAYAAVALLAGVAGLLGYRYLFNIPPSVDYAVISNADGKHSKIILPDSSIVYLGGGSQIRYARNFSGRERILYLNGEAFFDVAHKAARPFVVASGEIKTVVLGTSFNVKAYAAESKVTVTVQTGKVGVLANVQGHEQLVKYLTPNEQIQINTQSGLYTLNHADAAAVSAWISNNFVFYNTPLKDIAAALGHYYGVHIDFTDADMGAIKLTAKFKNISLAEVMQNLSALSGLAYTQKGNHLYFSDKNQKGGSIMK